MKYRILSLIALAALAAFPAFAGDFHAARASGAVGERLDGYVEALQNSPEVTATVSKVNEKRKMEYARISKEKSQSVEDVGKIAAQQVIENLPPGAMYQAPDGSWKKK